MSFENRIWNALIILGAMLTAAVPAYVAYDLWGRGPAPERRLQLRQGATIDPLTDLSSLGDKVAVYIQDRVIERLFIEQTYLENIGSTPIEPEDFHENISVNVDEPWQIIAVENSELFKNMAVQVDWRKVSETRVEAASTLLNPGDTVVSVVYITSKPGAVLKNDEKPTVNWKAHITNMRGFYTEPDFFDRQMARMSGLHIQIGGWAVPFLLISALVLRLFTYVFL
jgi:hypothetical protein